MPHPRYNSHEIAERGRKLYDEQLRAQVTPGNMGNFLVIDIETGEYEIDQEELAAIGRAKANALTRRCYSGAVGARTPISSAAQA